MCCLFGLIDTRKLLPGKQKSRLLHALATAAELRGRDASGIAYNTREKLVIRKAPVPGHLLQSAVGTDAVAVMGHTRMTTQGDAKKPETNHPFAGNTPAGPFALAHNGVLYNDRMLRHALRLPETPIETDSYIAVQLLEKRGALDFSTLRSMAETVEGSFTFTVLDRQDNLYIVKGDNPFCLLRWPRLGLFLYASTEEILELALRKTRFNPKGAVRVPLVSGEILRIDRKGGLTRSTFDDSGFCSGFYSGYDSYPHSPGFRSLRRRHGQSDTLRDLKAVAHACGYSPEAIDHLAARGFQPEEIEEFLYQA